MNVQLLPYWIILSALAVAMACLFALPAPALRHGQKSIGYWPLLVITLIGAIGVAGPWHSHKVTPLYYEAMALGAFFLIRNFGDARAHNASWLWLVGSQLAFVLMLFLSRGAFGESAYPWVATLILLLILPVWPLSFWWGEAVSQGPLPVAILLPVASFTLPGWLLGLNHLEVIGVVYFPPGWLAVLMLISLFIAALALGRQSDLKLALAFGIWAWILALTLIPLASAAEVFEYMRFGPPAAAANPEFFVDQILPFYKNSVAQPAASVSLLLAVTAFALLIGYLKKSSGSTFVEDFRPLAENPRLFRFRRCWTLATWLLAGLPVTFLWDSLYTTWHQEHASHLPASLLGIGVIVLAGSLFHLRARLFHGDTHTTGKIVLRDLPVGHYALILILLGGAAALPFLATDGNAEEEAIIYVQGDEPAAEVKTESTVELKQTPPPADPPAPVENTEESGLEIEIVAPTGDE